MSSMFCKIAKAVIFVSIFIFLAGCVYDGYFAANAKEPKKRSAWLAYWDLDAGEKDLKKSEKKLDTLSYFAAYFDKNDRIFIPAELSEKKAELPKREIKYETYLTVVNDKQNSDETIALKDLEVLRRVFINDEVMDEHIDELIATTLQGGYDGIEIDYERIWTDENVGHSFLRFANKLYQKAMENNLKLRIVLEPSAPFSPESFFKGPEYVVMFYNLYGLHSSPGPKANKEFINKMLLRMDKLPGEKSVALATGGCQWGSKGEKNFLTEAEAKALARKYRARTKRDEASQCLVFNYTDGDISYQVWYADVKTLNYWISLAKEHGINNISLWRFGGNVNIHKIN